MINDRVSNDVVSEGESHPTDAYNAVLEFRWMIACRTTQGRPSIVASQDAV
jgi:hypothetical protein